MIFVLVVCIVTVLYAYLGYPLFLFLATKLFSKKASGNGGDYTPDVTVVIAVHNEEKNILNRLNDLTLQNYPGEKIEVVVVSDGSTDKTVSLVNQFKESNNLKLKILELKPNQGKPNALNTAVKVAEGDVLVFTDARQVFDVNVISELVSNFVDPRIGCVSGELFFKQSHDSNIHQEMGLYWKYEKYIRKSESVLGSVVGVTGAIYAMRKELYKAIPVNTLIDDVLIPMNVVMQGYRVLFDEKAMAYDVVSNDAGQEWKRKVRTLSGNWQLLLDHMCLLNPFRNSIFFQFVSHKVLRLIVPFLLMIILLVSFILSNDGYLWLFVLQLIIYGVIAVSFMFPQVRKYRIINLMYFFTVLNAAAVVSFYKVIICRQTNLWQAAYKK